MPSYGVLPRFEAAAAVIDGGSFYRPDTGVLPFSSAFRCFRLLHAHDLMAMQATSSE